MDRLAETVFHAEHRVLGRKLRVLTYFHAFTLACFDSPLVGGSRPFSFDELAFAVRICSSTRKQLLRSLTRPTSLLEKAILWIQARLFMRDMVGQKQAFATYLRDAGAPPSFFVPPQAKMNKSPWPLSDVARLLHHGHFTLEQAWDAEPGFSAHLIPALQEASGHEVSIMSEAEARAMEEAGHVVR